MRERWEVCVRRPKAVLAPSSPKHTSNSDSRSFPLLCRVCSVAVACKVVGSEVDAASAALTKAAAHHAHHLLFGRKPTVREIGIRGRTSRQRKTIEVAEQTTRVVRHRKRATRVGPIGWLAERNLGKARQESIAL
jgi:hypothetical protein